MARQEQVTKLFQLPVNSAIVDFCLVEPWVVIAGENYLLFLHNYHSMDHFKHIDKVYPTKIELLPEDSSQVIILNQDTTIHCYKMTDKAVVLIRTLQIPFIIPYCLAEIDKHIFIAGIDR